MRKDVRSHEDLEVWKLAMRMAAEGYRTTAQLPRQERFGLQAQMRRAAVSVAANIAEGAARDSAADFSRFLAIARGSLSELDTQLVLCESLGFLTYREKLRTDVRLARVMLTRLGESLQRRSGSS